MYINPDTKHSHECQMIWQPFTYEIDIEYSSPNYVTLSNTWQISEMKIYMQDYSRLKQ